ncbi:hypothetical protein [Allonocardiopsis opalescens]|uniref:Holin n=1 Tax=Allonocardiopsis opalescens TaxID=1144618 RepID=A0A2T0PT36_9ACTN|nr:hypothetical protein [Allonocardiopsis opalescens]PRX91958.1 hypothetical protein CLV72_11231 [Allonocardiopsis opalescens]
MNVKPIFGRYPVFWVEFVGALLAVVTVYGLDISGNQNEAILAAVSAILTAVASVGVARDRFLVLLSAAFKALFAVAIAFGVDLSAEQVANTLVFLNAVLALFLPPQVTAKYGPDGERRPTAHLTTSTPSSTHG